MFFGYYNIEAFLDNKEQQNSLPCWVCLSVLLCFLDCDFVRVVCLQSHGERYGRGYAIFCDGLNDLLFSDSGSKDLVSGVEIFFTRIPARMERL